MPHPDPPLLSERFTDALSLAATLHRSQPRKGTRIPYISHLMSVSALVLEDGGGEDEAIAALLHDALEDCGDQISARDIEQRFGVAVRRIVESCTDTPPGHTGEKPAWKPRKVDYIAHLRASRAPFRVSLADKVHNARSILRDLEVHGPEVWDRFTGRREGTLWYYRELTRVFRERGASGYLIQELERVVAALETFAATSPAA
jgi:(p)ppGpp synthase/HD superfamily hydrolase